MASDEDEAKTGDFVAALGCMLRPHLRVRAATADTQRPPVSLTEIEALAVADGSALHRLLRALTTGTASRPRPAHGDVYLERATLAPYLAKEMLLAAAHPTQVPAWPREASTDVGALSAVVGLDGRRTRRHRRHRAPQRESERQRK